MALHRALIAPRRAPLRVIVEFPGYVLHGKTLDVIEEVPSLPVKGTDGYEIELGPGYMVDDGAGGSVYMTRERVRVLAND